MSESEELRAARAMRESVIEIVEDLERYAEADRRGGDWLRGRAAAYGSAAEWLRRHALAKWPVAEAEPDLNPCGQNDKDCGLNGGTARCGGCKS